MSSDKSNYDIEFISKIVKNVLINKGWIKTDNLEDIKEYVKDYLNNELLKKNEKTN